MKLGTRYKSCHSRLNQIPYIFRRVLIRMEFGLASSNMMYSVAYTKFHEWTLINSKYIIAVI
jgi:hypothetical protein